MKKLSPRETDILVLLVQGELNKNIAFLLGISEATVKVHVSNLMRKMGAKSRAGVVSIFLFEKIEKLQNALCAGAVEDALSMAADILNYRD